MLNDVSSIGVPIAILFVTTGFVWSAAWWLQSQLSGIKHDVFSRLDKMQDSILDKLEYHERHDDQRFLQMGNDIWAIKVRNAALDGQTSAFSKKTDS